MGPNIRLVRARAKSCATKLCTLVIYPGEQGPLSLVHNKGAHSFSLAMWELSVDVTIIAFVELAIPTVVMVLKEEEALLV